MSLNIPARDTFAKAAIALMRQIDKVGYVQALKNELETPTLEDKEWATMIVELLQEAG